MTSSVIPARPGAHTWVPQLARIQAIRPECPGVVTYTLGLADAGERSATVTVPQASADPSNVSVTWSSVPANCGGTTQTYARFRIGTVQSEVESPTGLAVDGDADAKDCAIGLRECVA